MLDSTEKVVDNEHQPKVLENGKLVPITYSWVLNRGQFGQCNTPT
jgi:hypothetical protein